MSVEVNVVVSCDVGNCVLCCVVDEVSPVVSVELVTEEVSGCVADGVVVSAVKDSVLVSLVEVVYAAVISALLEDVVEGCSEEVSDTDT